MNLDRKRNYSHNNIYNVLAGDGFAKMDGSYSGATVEEIYGSDLAPDLALGYFDGWEDAIYAFIYDCLSWGCVVISIFVPGGPLQNTSMTFSNYLDFILAEDARKHSVFMVQLFRKRYNRILILQIMDNNTLLD